jgi:hypothetical protein
MNFLFLFIYKHMFFNDYVVTRELINLGSVYFDLKWFLENNLRILWCLLQYKIVVNRKYFSFDQKFFLNFWKMVYG